MWEMENFSLLFSELSGAVGHLCSLTHPSISTKGSCHGLELGAAPFGRGMGFTAGLGLEDPSGCSPRSWRRINKNF